MLLRLIAPLRQLMLTLLLALMAMLIAPTVHATEAEVTSAKLETTDEGYRISASFSFELSRGLVDAISKEIPLSFTTEVEMTRPRWYWFDEKTIRSTQTVRIAYNPWTRNYTATINNGLQQNFPTLEDALALVLRPRRWIVAEKGSLTPGAVYNVGIKLKLDLSYLPKTFLITSLNDSDWRFSSDWKRFTFKVEEK
ncbi:DUF4390 domain-containing protein [Undibacterium sp. Dicai25W]|uniref:DUF4390 domain-containing protein n=1 Tax=Undibacterium sp. Dicai25W TaxID=3413034 RepID=UPI003BEF9C27